FIDMVLESNRDLVLRRLTECLGRDRTKHQVAEITSLGLVQMTRKRVGEGLLEAFSETCEVCHGTGVILHSEPVAQPRNAADDTGPPARRKNGGAAKAGAEADDPALAPEQRQKALAAMAAIHRAAHPDQYADDGTSAELELDAVETVLAGSPIDAELLEVDVADPAGVTDPEPQALPVEPEPPGTELTAGPRAEPEPPRSSRPRRRRSASRPAGPPVPG
ncbi:MAG: ribonuclease E/G, partial [Actinomycetota bacterium]|nr:ribonuclease E/G [Actinomycetota bacterium]